ncbi:hypothetical protein WT25_02025 [Burkholderia territorii]|uniref:hypothetical protein n=1 Tax=Burkholderia territorii TaxID=1503055 RepID=UPI000754A520|nr:hypothetical protein [Burkholderia territorii]KVT75689.1 hypothetical protein WT25_02025 [Burkholderia territorii]
MTEHFFESRLDAVIDLRHPLAVLATRMSWSQLEATFAPLFARRERAGCATEDVDLFGTAPKLACAVLCAAGFNLRRLMRAIARIGSSPASLLAGRRCCRASYDCFPQLRCEGFTREIDLATAIRWFANRLGVEFRLATIPT